LEATMNHHPQESFGAQDDGTLNLDSLNFDELGHVPVCGGEVENEPVDLSPEEVAASLRSNREPHHRELLKNEFPPEDAGTE
jgi:hypothetical protein